MSIQLNHTIVSCRDQQRSASFRREIFGPPPASRFARFLVVEADNGVSLDFAETSGPITAQHYAFLVGEEEFDAAFAPSEVVARMPRCLMPTLQLVFTGGLIAVPGSRPPPPTGPD